MFLLLVVFFLVSCANSKNEPYELDVAAIDARAQQLMKGEDVQGMALAVIEDGKVVHVAAYGRRSVERDLQKAAASALIGTLPGPARILRRARGKCQVFALNCRVRLLYFRRLRE
jgi:hypothetical protein